MGISKRQYYLDFLRIIAIVFVLFNHRECYHHFLAYDDFGFKYILTIVPSILCKCGPPLFLMISGALLLRKKDEAFKDVFKHRIVRILIVMIIAALWKSRVNFSFGYILKTFASGLNWYLYAYLGFLFMLPFLRNIVNNSTKDKTTLFFGLTLGFYSLQALSIVFGMNFSLFSNVPLFNSYYASSCWMIIFPIAGYYVANADSIYTDKKDLYKFRIALIISSVVSVAVSIMLITYDIKNNGGNNLEQLRQHFIFAPSCLIFYLCKIVVDKYQHRITKIPARIITEISGATFGMYLLEVFTLISENLYKELVVIASPVVGTYLTSFVCIFFSLLIYTVIVVPIRKVPIINKIL